MTLEAAFFPTLQHQHTITRQISFADHVKLSGETTGKTLP